MVRKHSYPAVSFSRYSRHNHKLRSSAALTCMATVEFYKIALSISLLSLETKQCHLAQTDKVICDYKHISRGALLT